MKVCGFRIKTFRHVTNTYFSITIALNIIHPLSSLSSLWLPAREWRRSMLDKVSLCNIVDATELKKGTLLMAYNLKGITSNLVSLISCIVNPPKSDLTNIYHFLFDGLECRDREFWLEFVFQCNILSLQPAQKNFRELSKICLYSHLFDFTVVFIV